LREGVSEVRARERGGLADCTARTAGRMRFRACCPHADEWLTMTARLAPLGPSGQMGPQGRSVAAGPRVPGVPAAPALKLCISAVSTGLNVGSASAQGICSKKITLSRSCLAAVLIYHLVQPPEWLKSEAHCARQGRAASHSVVLAPTDALAVRSVGSTELVSIS